METNKDLILRSIKYFSEFLMALTKQKPIKIEEVDGYINEFVLKHFNITFQSILENKTEDIIKKIGGESDCENIKDFASVLFVRYTLENNSVEKRNISQKIIELYQIYQSKSSIYSFEIQLRIDELKNSV